MKLAIIGGIAGVAFCVSGIVVSLVLLDIPLNLFIAVPSAIVGGVFVFLLLMKPKQKEPQFIVKEIVELDQKE